MQFFITFLFFLFVFVSDISVISKALHFHPQKEGGEISFQKINQKEKQLLILAQQAVRSGKFSNAIKFYEELETSSDPWYSWAGTSGKVVTYRRQNNWDMAKDVTAKIRSKNPALSGLMFIWDGDTAIKEGDLEGAAYAYNQAATVYQSKQVKSNFIVTPVKADFDATGCNSHNASTGFQNPFAYSSYGDNFMETWSQDGVSVHPGVDLNLSGGDCNLEFVAVADGCVIEASPEDWGSATIQHYYAPYLAGYSSADQNYWVSQYGHAYTIVGEEASGSFDWSSGMAIGKGAQLGTIGDVDASSCHLHFEIRDADHPDKDNADAWYADSEEMVADYYDDPESFIDAHHAYSGGLWFDEGVFDFYGTWTEASVGAYQNDMKYATSSASKSAYAQYDFTVNESGNYYFWMFVPWQNTTSEQVPVNLYRDGEATPFLEAAVDQYGDDSHSTECGEAAAYQHAGRLCDHWVAIFSTELESGTEYILEIANNSGETGKRIAVDHFLILRETEGGSGDLSRVDTEVDDDDGTDTDGDGLSDAEEELWGSDPNDTDSDDDSLHDGDEVNTYGSDPNDRDTDDDGIEDWGELHFYEGSGIVTDPTDADTDDDGLIDGEEISRGLDPTDSDSDDDGLEDGVNDCTVDSYVTADADGDGLDYDDELACGTDSNDTDSDDDGLTDYEEVVIYLTNPTEAGFSFLLTSGSNPFSGNDSYENVAFGQSVTSCVSEDGTYSYPASNLVDGNTSTLAYPANTSLCYQIDLGTAQPLEVIWITWGEFMDSIVYDPTWTVYGTIEDGREIPLASKDISADADSLYIYSIYQEGGERLEFSQLRIEATSSNWVGLYEFEAYVSFVDTDGDGLSDYQEENTYGTDPNDTDTDDDGINDGEEVSLYGTNPRDSDSDDDGVSDYQEFAPTAYDDAAKTAPNTLVGIDVRINDIDPNGDYLTLVSVSDPEHGSATFTAADSTYLDHIVYTPDTDFVGTDSFTYTVSDASGFSSSATVTVTVSIDSAVYNSNDNDDFGVTYNDGDNVALNKPVELLMSEILSEEEFAAYEETNAPYTVGYPPEYLVDGSSSTLAFSAYNTLYYEIDLEGSYPLESIWLNWQEYGNDGSSAATYMTDWLLAGITEDGAEIILADQGSPDSSYSLVFLGETLQEIEFSKIRVYAAGDNWLGIYELSAYLPFIDSDADGLSDYQETETYGTDSNDNDSDDDGVSDYQEFAPTAYDDAAETIINTLVAIDVRINDIDPNGDYLTLVSVSDPEHGLATFVEGDITYDHIRYTPDADFVGADSFVYTVSDASGFSSSATVTVTVSIDSTVYNSNDDFGVTYNSSDNVALNKPVELLMSEILSEEEFAAYEETNAPYTVGYPPEYLVDGSSSTLAFSAYNTLYYEIDLEGSYPLESIWLNWWEYGNDGSSAATYMTDWHLTGIMEDGAEIILADQGSPDSSYSLVFLGETLQEIEFSKIRVYAAGDNWLGIYELSAYLPFIDSDADGLSDYQETETYGTDSNDNDSDDDGLSDETEINSYGSDPMNSTDPAGRLIPILSSYLNYPKDCIPPSSGTAWTIAVDCTLSRNKIWSGDLYVRDGAIMTIPSGISLDMDFSQKKLVVESGSGVLIEQGGKVY